MPEHIEKPLLERLLAPLAAILRLLEPLAHPKGEARDRVRRLNELEKEPDEGRRNEDRP